MGALDGHPIAKSCNDPDEVVGAISVILLGEDERRPREAREAARMVSRMDCHMRNGGLNQLLAATLDEDDGVTLAADEAA